MFSDISSSRSALVKQENFSMASVGQSDSFLTIVKFKSGTGNSRIA